MQPIKYFRGIKANYILEVHGQGIYFATDTKEILHNGAPYIGLPINVRVEDVVLDNEGSAIIVKFSDGSNKKIEIGSGKYKSNIEDQNISMTTAYGDFSKGTKVGDLNGMTYDQMFDAILFPTVDPIFTSPSSSISLKNYPNIQEVGSVAPTVENFTVSFNPGEINLDGVKQSNRAGVQDLEKSYIYVGGDVNNKVLPSTISLGENSYQYHVEYSEGPQPKNNKNVNYSTPLAAGSVNSIAVKVSGTYPWFASTSTATVTSPVVKQSLIAWDNNTMSTPKFEVQPSGILPQVFKLPRQLKTLQILNTVSGNMEIISTSEYTETKEMININGQTHEYFVYTYNGSDRSSVTLLAKF